jgi:hypothetical protein
MRLIRLVVCWLGGVVARTTGLVYLVSCTLKYICSSKQQKSSTHDINSPAFRTKELIVSISIPFSRVF